MLNGPVWVLVCFQIAMGAADIVIHHEFTERLTWRRSQAKELWLHGARNLFYAAIFAIVGTTTPTGAYAAILLAVLYAELVITLWDFVEEDRTRALPPSERVLHTLLALNYGAILMGVTPPLLALAALPTGLVVSLNGLPGVACLIASAGTIVFGLRDFGAAARWRRIVPRRASDLLQRNSERRSILITGGTGFIGSRLVEALAARGDDVTVLTRSPCKAARLATPVRIITSLEQLPDTTRLDVIVNLAGQPITGFLWTARYRRKLLRSRLQMTRDVLRLIARLRQRPAVLISGSAIGIYGVTTAGFADEATAIATDGSFAQRLCLSWEQLAGKAETLGVRTVMLRTGLVLDTDGSSLGQMLPVFEYGLGGPFGRGLNWMSWISRDDLVRLIAHAIGDQKLRGPLNGVAPAPIRNLEFSRTIGAALHRPAIIPLPEALLKAGLGDLAREIFLGSQQVRPARALQHGFAFFDPDLGLLIRRLVGTKTAPLTATPLSVATPRLNSSGSV